MSRREPDDFAFRPIPVVVQFGAFDERTMPAGRRHHHHQIGVVGDERVAKRLGRDERIVFGCDDERRNADTVDDAHGAGPMVVVGGVAEAMMRRRVGIVELANGLHVAQPRQVA